MAETSDQLSQVTESLRKPETRTPFTEVLVSQAQVYFSEIFNQQNPPEVVQQFKNHKGMISLTGSVLRGTAKPGSSDIDTFLLYEDPEKLLSPAEVGKIVTASEDYHPSHTSFPRWLAKKCKENPEWQEFYKARRKYAESGGSPATDENIEKYFIQVDADSVNISELSEDITNEKIFSEDWELNLTEDLIPQLLTATPDYAIATSSGNLLHYQQKIIGTLANLESKNPSLFPDLYNRLSLAFKRTVLYEGGNHEPSVMYYNKLMRDYIENSGKFEGKLDRATEILKSVKKQVKFPPFDLFKKTFLGTIIDSGAAQNDG